MLQKMVSILQIKNLKEKKKKKTTNEQKTAQYRLVKKKKKQGSYQITVGVYAISAT